MGYKLIKEHYEELIEILDCIKAGVYITDGEGNTLLMNAESEKTGGLSREEVVGKNMKELIEIDGHIGSLEEIMNAYEKEILTEIMQKCQNASEAARLLKINKSTISRKLAKYNIKKR